MGVYRGEFPPGNPKFVSSSAAACKEASGPVEISAPDITYSSEDEKILENYNRQFGVLIPFIYEDIYLIIFESCSSNGLALCKHMSYEATIAPG